MTFLRSLLLILPLSLCCAPLFAQEASWPTKMVRIIVPTGAGIGPDIVARAYANELQKSLGQTFIVENRVGAAGIIGTETVAKAAPDGSTVLFGFNHLVTMNQHLYSKLPYDPLRDLQPASIVATGAFVLLANNQLPANNIQELIALAKRQPGKLLYATNGPGTAVHLGVLLLEKQAGISMTEVPYKSGGNALTDLIGGTVELSLQPAATAVSLAREGKLKALAVTGTERLEVLPSVPTVAETVPGYEMKGWNALWLPAKTPDDVIRRLQDELIRITRMPEIAARLRSLGLEPAGTTAQEMTEIIQREATIWGEIIKANNIKLD